MKKIVILLFTLFLFSSLNAQTKISGRVLDEFENPVAFANIIFKGSSEGTITNDNGRFYFESDKNYNAILVSFIGYESQEVALASKVNYELEIVLKESTEQLSEVVVYTGKQSKKNNPAIDILKKIWAKKRENGVRKFSQYKYCLLYTSPSPRDS